MTTKKWSYNKKEEVLNFSNGGQLDKLQIINLKGNWSPKEVRDDLLEEMPEGWDEEQIEEFYDFLLESE